MFISERVWCVAAEQCLLVNHNINSTGLSTEEWIKKMWDIYTMEYYSAIKKDEIMPFAATWTGLDTVMLSKVSQTEKGQYHLIPLICGI